MALNRFYIDDEFQIECGMPEYEESGLCDDCICEVNGRDFTRKRVKCVGWDGLYFCEKHWSNYVRNMFNGPDGEGGLPDDERSVVEPFNVSRDTIRDGVMLYDGTPDFHIKSNC